MGSSRARHSSRAKRRTRRERGSPKPSPKIRDALTAAQGKLYQAEAVLICLAIATNDAEPGQRLGVAHLCRLTCELIDAAQDSLDVLSMRGAP